MAAHGGGLAGEVEHQIQRMDGLIDEHAAALGLVEAAPAALGVILGGAVPVDRGAHGQQLAVAAVSDGLADELGGLIIAVLEHDGEAAVGMADHLLRVGNLAGHGLLGEHALARIEQRDGHGRVQVVRRADVHYVDVVTGDVLRPIGGVRAAVLLGAGLCAVLLDVGDGDEFDVVHVAQGVQMHLGDASAADERGANLCHD